MLLRRLTYRQFCFPIALLWTSMACSSGPSPVAPNNRHDATWVDSLASLRFSMDGNWISYLSAGQLRLRDTRSGADHGVDLDGVVAARWQEDGTLLALAGPLDRRSLWRLTTPAFVATRLKAANHVLSLMAAPGAPVSLWTQGSWRSLSLGTQLQLQLQRDKVGDRPLFEVDTLLRVKNLRPQLPGWRDPARHPLWGVTLSEYKKPPRLPGYLRLLWVDPTSGDVEELGRHLGLLIDSAQSWSANGQRLAFVDAKRRLCVFDVGFQAPARCLDRAPRGRQPVYHPEAAMLFFGGQLLDRQGQIVDPLAGADERALARWSEDGRYLAVQTGSRIQVHEPSWTVASATQMRRSRLRDQQRRLAAVLDKKLIEVQVYRQRRDALRQAYRSLP